MEKEQTTNTTKNRLAAFSEHDKACVTVVMYNLIFCNELAITAMFDAIQKLKATPYYRHAVKRWGNMCQAEMKLYNGMLNKRSGGHIEFIADLNDIYEEYLNVDVMRLRNVTKMRLDREHIEDSELKAYIYTAATLSLAALHNNNHAFDGFPELKYLHRRFKWMRISSLSATFIKMTDALHKMAADDYSDLLNDDQQVMTGFKVLANKLHDGDDIITILNQHADQWVAEHGEEVVHEV